MTDSISDVAKDAAIKTLTMRLRVLVAASAEIQPTKLGTVGVTLNQEGELYHIPDHGCLLAVRKYISEEISVIKTRLQDLGVDTTHMEF